MESIINIIKLYLVDVRISNMKRKSVEMTFVIGLFVIGILYLYLHFIVTNKGNEEYSHKKKLRINSIENIAHTRNPETRNNTPFNNGKPRENHQIQTSLYVLTTGVRKFDPLTGYETITVIGQKQTNTVSPTFDEGYGPRKWPDGARRVTDGHVTVWKEIASSCSDWCFVSEDDAIWPLGIPSELPSDGFVSFFRESVCAEATEIYSENYERVVKAVIPGKCMPYGAVAYAITGDFAKMLLSKLPMSKPVDHFLWEQAVVHKKAYVSRRYVVRHKKGKSLRQNTHVPMLSKNPEYVQGTGISDEYGGTESAKHKKRRQSVTLSTITEFGRECQKVYSGIGPDSLCNGIVPIDNPYMKSIGHGLNLSGSGRAFLSKPMRFSDFEFSCYSQTTEDGVLLSILESIGVTNRRAVEIAGGVGWENNLANLVINFGFETLFFDGDPGNVRCARNFFDHHPSTRHHPPVFADDFVSAENINSLIKSKGWSGPIDVFSLDIDGVDYWIWDAIEIIQPRVVVVEIQELWGPEERWTRPYNSNFHSDGIPSMGASLAAFDYLARKKGYRLVGCVKAGFNAFFVSESAANLDDIFGSGSYDRSGCFAHVDQHWRTVLDNRREKASKYSWVDPKTGKYLSNSNTVTDPKIAVAIPTYKADEHALTQKYVVVMPSVKRNNDIYLKKTLASLEVAKPSEITVILVNGHQPPEHHSYLNDWCASHESYKCIVPPPVPDSLIEDVVSNDKRHDTVEYLRWRTTEAIHAMFGMKEFLKTGGEYMIWLQDDVTIEKDLFLSLPDEEIICLRSDGYCGMVAYMFKRSFVQQLLPRLEIDFKDMPIDWILDNVWGKDVVRIPKAYHHGFISSNGKIRHKTKNEASKASKPSPKIAVAIPTYNRAGYVQLCAAALSKTIPSNDVWIFDDHSTEYTAGDLQKWFGSPSVQRNVKRFKADKQARHILEWFVGTDYDWLITLDSDLIVRPDWLELLQGMLPHTQGVMSLYHSGNPNHPTLHCDPNLCEMKSLGNAGVAWSKVLAKRMLVDMTQSDGFDWGWTEWLQKRKIPQYAAKDSLVLHVGMHGTWGADSKREKSVGFPMDKLSPDVRGRAELFLKGINP